MKPNPATLPQRLAEYRAHRQREVALKRAVLRVVRKHDLAAMRNTLS